MPTIARVADAIDGQPRSRAVPWSAVTADRLLGGAALALSAYLLLHLLVFEYGRDQGIYAVVAEGVMRGDIPYRDLWDFKPPGIFFVFALAHALFGNGMQAIRVLEALAFMSVPLAFAIFSRRHLGSALAGLLGGACAVCAHVQLEFWNTAQPESFAAVAVTWALVCATWEPRDRSARHGRQLLAWLAAGALYGFAAILKPPLGGGIVVSAAVLTAHRWRGWVHAAGAPRPTFFLAASQRVAFALVPALSLAAGALLPLLIVLGYFAAAGALSDLYQVLFIFTPRYTALGLRDAAFGALLLRAAAEWFAGFSVLNGVGLLLLGASPALPARARGAALHVAGVIAVVLFGVALQAKFFPYHYDVALVLSGLLAGWGFWKLWLRLRPAPIGQFLFVAVAGASIVLSNWAFSDGEPFWSRSSLRLVAWLNPEMRASANDYLYSIDGVDAAANRRAADWLRANTGADQTVFIWGFEPVIYQLAGRRSASRYVYNVAQRVEWDQPRARRRLLADLFLHQPAAIIVEHGDRLPWVTGNSLDSAAALRGFPALRRLLERRYVAAGSARHLDFYLRR